MDYTKTMIRLPKDLLAAVDTAAERESVSRNQMISEVLSEAFPAALPSGWTWEGKGRCAWRGKPAPVKEKRTLKPTGPRGRQAEGH